MCAPADPKSKTFSRSVHFYAKGLCSSPEVREPSLPNVPNFIALRMEKGQDELTKLSLIDPKDT
jgi:hypothetical protein